MNDLPDPPARMKPPRNRLQQRVRQRLEAGLPPTRWQQFRLHLQTMVRQLRHRRFSTIWFHGKGVARIAWQPFTVCRLLGVPVQFHITWFVYPAGFLVWLLYDDEHPWRLDFPLLILFILCLSLLFHEYAHVLTARRFGIGSRRVIIIPPGAAAELETPLSGPREFWIALAGPVSSLLLAELFQLGLLALAASVSDWFSDYGWRLELRDGLRFGYALNQMLAGFNLLPCFPMDGGRMLRSALAVVVGRFFPHYPVPASLIATRIAVRCFAWPVALVMMVYSLQRRDYWLYLLLFPLLLFAAEIEYQTLREANAPQNEGENPGAD